MWGANATLLTTSRANIITNHTTGREATDFNGQRTPKRELGVRIKNFALGTPNLRVFIEGLHHRNAR